MSKEVLYYQKDEIAGEIKIVKEDSGEMNCYANGKLIDRFRLLACATNQEDEEEAWEIMRVASKIFHPMDDPYFNHLYGVCGIYLAWEFSHHRVRKLGDKIKVILKNRKYKSIDREN